MGILLLPNRRIHLGGGGVVVYGRKEDEARTGAGLFKG